MIYKQVDLSKRSEERNRYHCLFKWNEKLNIIDFNHIQKKNIIRLIHYDDYTFKIHIGTFEIDNIVCFNVGACLSFPFGIYENTWCWHLNNRGLWRNHEVTDF